MDKPVERYSGKNIKEKLYPENDISIRCFYPAEDLCFFIKNYWIVKVKDTKKFKKVSQISPSGYPELIYHFGDSVSVCSSEEGSPKVSYDSFIAGQITQSIHLYFDNHINSLCVKLQPYTLKALFKIKSSEFTNRATSLKDISPKMQDDIYARISEADNDNMRIRIIENHLRMLLKKNSDSINSVTCAAVNHLKDNINRNTGGLGQIMDKSSRTIQRRVLEDVGVSPKFLERIFRFNKAYYLIKHNRDLDLQDISFYLDYYDLSHLINEFKEFTGRSPVNYFKNEDIYNSLFAGIF